MLKSTLDQPIKRLTCSCCGESCFGRQWHNRDTGFGLCPDCGDRIQAKGTYTAEEFVMCYGFDGVNFNLGGLNHHDGPFA